MAEVVQVRQIPQLVDATESATATATLHVLSIHCLLPIALVRVCQTTSTRVPTTTCNRAISRPLLSCTDSHHERGLAEMASSTTRIPASENMSPGKKTARAPLDIGKRAPLQELTPNASMARTLPDANPKGRKSMPSSPLKRQLKDVLGDDKGLTYLKRRRLSHDQALNTSIAGAARDKKDTTGFRPLSPPSSRGYVAVSNAIQTCV